MAPLTSMDVLVMAKRLPGTATTRTSPPNRESMTTEGGFLEAWAQGYNVGSLIILILIVFCNYRSGMWLHKLILLEVSLGAAFIASTALQAKRLIAYISY